tara:strand:- start:193 stop:681 length:489 start_codon:yes stop_codon:yes gene_type:complete
MLKKKIEAEVNEVGFSCVTVFDEVRPQHRWTYSVGFERTLGLANIVVFDLEHNISSVLIKDAYGLCKEHGCLADKSFPLLAAHDVFFRQVDMRWVDEFGLSFLSDEGGAFLQMFWPDSVGLFPWESGFEPRFANLQPMLFLSDGEMSGASEYLYSGTQGNLF